MNFCKTTIDKIKSVCYTENRKYPVEAEIKAVTPSQRARGAVNRAGNELSNGPPRVRRNMGELSLVSILQRVGIRQLPGICLYP